MYDYKNNSFIHTEQQCRKGSSIQYFMVLASRFYFLFTSVMYSAALFDGRGSVSDSLLNHNCKLHSENLETKTCFCSGHNDNHKHAETLTIVGCLSLIPFNKVLFQNSIVPYGVMPLCKG